ncbi:response regulator transcription factor [Streptomyces sp. MUM 136J]|uniref:response regulator transcription factor n=1 Tax=Streptomyces sp. MUM 136J TaxID=2791992 RepID=UPI001F03AE9C|nr:response regulator transcription factor [Streptomyces sp. MUM 136J]MCH0569079.1 response regulator transcription factor [Streptomyces sp. MUM 136J]
MATVDPRAQGLSAYERSAWRDAYEHLSAADRQRPLPAGDLDRMARAAYLIGAVDAAAETWERAHHAHLARGDTAPAVRSAFWLGIMLVLRGEHARGGGWLARAQHLLTDTALDCAEQGYLRIPTALRALDGGDAEAAHRSFAEITAIAERFGDADLRAFGTLGQGQALVAQGRVARGVALLDEVMVAVTTGEVSPITAGIVYCAVILACRGVFDLRRVQEWTAALSRWCAAQQDLRPYRGQCLVHRSEIMQLRGEWADAMDEARRACAHLSDPPGDPVMGMALYQRGELHRLRGAYSRAEDCYREAIGHGHPAQPGLALLRMAQGRVGAAAAAVRRAVAETRRPEERPLLLAARAEIEIAAGAVEAARDAVDELDRIAAGFDSPYLRAVVAYAHGCLLLAAGEPGAACTALRSASAAWHELDAPYETARVRLQLARACLRVGDHDTAGMELQAARRVFERVRATPALEEVRRLLGQGSGAAPVPGGLTPREVEVLRLVATGASNREIADRLVISDRTVARHLSNMFTKLGVSSRAAATAYAYEHGLA